MNKLIIYIFFQLFYSQSISNTVGYKVKFLQDNENKKCLSSIALEKFQDMPFSESFGLENGNYWFKLSIEKVPEKLNSLILEIPTHNIAHLKIYEKTKSGVIKIIDMDEEKAMRIHSPFPTFCIKIKNKTKSIFFLRTYFDKEANFPVRLYTKAAYHKNVYGHYIFTGIYYGVLGAIILCNLIFSIKFDEKSYLYYLIFLSTYSVAILFQDGSMSLMLSHKIRVNIEAVIHLFTQMTMFLFAINFLKIKKHLQGFIKYAIILSIGMAIATISFIITHNFWFYVVADSIAMISFLITWIVVIVYLRKIKFAKFYIIGYSLLLIFGFHFLFSYDFGIIPNNGKSPFLKIASIIDMLIFTYAISYRLDILNKDFEREKEALHQLLLENKKMNDIDPLYILLEENSLTNKALTMQEIKVLKCISEEMSNQKIAEKLFVSNNTIKFHIRNIYKKLDVNNRKEAKSKLTNFNL